MSDDEIQQLKSEHAALLAEKAKRVLEWHEEVRKTLHDHGTDLTVIKQSIAMALLLQGTVEKHATRIQALEDFKRTAVGWMLGAGAVIAAFWKIIERLWQ